MSIHVLMVNASQNHGGVIILMTVETTVMKLTDVSVMCAETLSVTLVDASKIVGCVMVNQTV